LRVGAGLTLRCLSHFCKQHGIGELSFCDGIPGTVGGAIAMNAGAFGSCVGDFVDSVDFVDCNGNLFCRKKIEFSYSRSSLPHGAIVVSVTFRRKKAISDVDAITRETENMARIRREKQPRMASAGSIFRNPPGCYAGQLIDAVGLKCACVGGASISSIHGNFIVSDGTATSFDVLALIFLVQRTVVEHFGIDLRTEICFLSTFWEWSF
jgi:UDP-N-acetylmuramate dehydrogenase